MWLTLDLSQTMTQLVHPKSIISNRIFGASIVEQARSGQAIRRGNWVKKALYKYDVQNSKAFRNRFNAWLMINVQCPNWTEGLSRPYFVLTGSFECSAIGIFLFEWLPTCLLFLYYYAFFGFFFVEILLLLMKYSHVRAPYQLTVRKDDYSLSYSLL